MNTRDKEIQDMIKTACYARNKYANADNLDEGCNGCPQYFEDGDRCYNTYFNREMAAIYDAGYRKADEVVKELLIELCDTVFWYDECDEPVYAHDCVWYVELCKKYGVEVD